MNAVAVGSKECVCPRSKRPIHRVGDFGRCIERRSDNPDHAVVTLGHRARRRIADARDRSFMSLDSRLACSNCEEYIGMLEIDLFPRVFSCLAMGPRLVVSALGCRHPGISLLNRSIQLDALARLLVEPINNYPTTRHNRFQFAAVPFRCVLERPEITPQVGHEAFRRKLDLLRDGAFLVFERFECDGPTFDLVGESVPDARRFVDPGHQFFHLC